MATHGGDSQLCVSVVEKSIVDFPRLATYSVCMKLKVTFNNIVVKPIENTSTIVVIDDRLPVKGEVLVVGPGTKKSPMQIEIGDIVFYFKLDARKMKLEGEDFHILSQMNIVAYQGK